MTHSERLATLEERVDNVRVDLQEHRAESKAERKELRDMIAQLGVKIDESKFPWASVFSKENVKLMVGLVLTLAGAAGAAKALLE